MITNNKTLGVVLMAGVVLALTSCAAVESIARGLGASDSEAKAMSGASGAAVNKMTPIGWEEELEYGGAIAVMIVNTYGGIVRDQALNLYVNRVGWTVAMSSPRPDIRYYFGVLDSDDVQAMAAPGGYVFITRGLLGELQSEAELAGVLAHEVAHVCNKDTLDIIQNLKAKQSLGKAAGAWRGGAAFSSLMDDFMTDFLTNGLPKDVELVADVDGAAISSAAGYDPQALRTALERIDHALHHHHGGDASFNKTHPEFDERFDKLDAKLATLPKGGQTNTERFKQAMARLR